MNFNVSGQFLNVILSGVLIGTLLRSGLSGKYLPFLVFSAFESVQALIYIGLRYGWSSGVRLVDYRLAWCSLRLIAWMLTFWMVYALLIRILKQLPGILAFSLRLLNTIIGSAIVLALITVRPEYEASKITGDPDWRARLTVVTLILERAFSFGELLAILSIVIFVMFFPIRVPQNLAAFTIGLCIYLCCQIGWLLGRTYFPEAFAPIRVDLPPFVLAGCLTFWLILVTPSGEEKTATLGRAWHSVPKEHLVRQLEALNVALSRSREQA